MDSTEESDSRTAAFTKKRKHPGSLQFDGHHSDSGDKRLKLEALRSRYNALEPGKISHTTSSSRRPSKDSTSSEEVLQVGKVQPSGWTLINAQPGTINETPFRCDYCSQSFYSGRDLKKHIRNHSKVNRDPFVDSHEYGNAPGFGEGYADGTISTNSHQYGTNFVASSGRLDPTASTDNIPARIPTNQDQNPTYEPKRLRSGGQLSKEDYAAMARWLERNDNNLELHDIQHAGLKVKVVSMLKSHNLDERGGVATVLEKLSCGGDYNTPARAFVKQRYEAVRSEMGVGRHDDGRVLNGDAQSEVLPQNKHQYMVQWLETRHDGPKVHDIQDSELRERVRKMMKSKHIEDDANIAALLSRISQRKNKHHRESACTWLKEYYETARRSAPDRKGIERDPQSKEGWLERALAVGEEYQTTAIGLLRLDDSGWRPKIQQEVAKHASRCTHKSIEEILREAVVRKWRVHKHAARRLRTGYQSQNVTDGPRLDILQASLPNWSLDELEKVMNNPTSFLRPLIASDVIRRAAHSEVPTYISSYMQSEFNYSVAQCLLEAAKCDLDDGFAKQCLAEFVSINYVGGEEGTSIHSRDGVEDFIQSKPAGRPLFEPLNQGEQELADAHSDRDQSSSPSPSPIPQELFDHGELAREAAARKEVFPDAAQASENARLTEQLDQDYEMEGSQAYSADYEYLQQRYFHTSDAESFRCLCCGGEGHGEDSCPSLTCDYCGVVDDHFSGACPTIQKCGRCRQRGHLTTNCTTPSTSLMLVLDDKCDVCGRSDHVEEECSDLWRSLLGYDEVVNLVPAQAMRVNCYNCGATDRFGFRSSHWGDDCPKMGRFDRSVEGLNDTFSANHADKFIQKKFEQQPQQSAGYGSVPRYQLAMLGD